ncbi:hypothetical protein PR003_g2517 [Phytophthora rubi]|uniref:Uncharacterized protein n=2 Tax=Phytophthora TaxID=4783 RepID=A0A6A3NT89_9STRA|nr:hypothetical protein PR002_g350 [Phytophthora rubi]KAE9052599.1 hypothetical protein PR001_g372 [Phytophthora rubi]KAE9304884.1 hypothetical protein PF008_g21867 [Phytophthora fragariae]KAE9356093.1 hypothetical protein PR003_g2517 [Phytophthora rubi]
MLSRKAILWHLPTATQTTEARSLRRQIAGFSLAGGCQAGPTGHIVRTDA